MATAGSLFPSVHSCIDTSGLNAEQLKAVSTVDRSLLVIAGAGTGKTRILTNRIAYLIQSGRARPDEVLAVTFTNKAGTEIRERLGAMIGPSADAIWAGSFHAISLRILRHHAEEAGLVNEHFSVIDEDDQIAVLSDIIEGATTTAGNERPAARRVHARIMSWKEEGLSPEDMKPGLLVAPIDRQALDLWSQYQGALAEHNVVDYADLLWHVTRLFSRFPTIRREWQDRFRFVHVDELQDANALQYAWLEGLVPASGNICGVGDGRQAIYEWRSARPELMEAFTDYWPNAETVSVTENYRSTQEILAVANLVIDPLKIPGAVPLRGSRTGAPVELVRHRNALDEIKSVVDEIEAAVAAGTPADEIAILLRAGYLMDGYAAELRKRGIQVVKLGGEDLLEQEEIKDMLAYLRLASNPYDATALLRIGDRPNRGIGERLLRFACDQAFGDHLTLPEGLRKLSRRRRVRMSSGQRAAMRSLADRLEEMSALEARGSNVSDIVSVVTQETGLLEWRIARDPESESKLRAGFEAISIESEGYAGSLRDFLGHLSLGRDTTEIAPGKVVLSTMHSSKGLEFDLVFTPVMLEGVSPSRKAIAASPDPAEERRLAHVAWSRAKHRLVISSPALNEFKPATRSRYLDEVEGLFKSGPFVGAVAKPAPAAGPSALPTAGVLGRALSRAKDTFAHQARSRAAAPTASGRER